MVEEELHVRGRQHVDRLERTRQRLAYGFALARALNRTVVLPTLWCYCDKFWHRLSQCAIPSATSSQPLPFVCPLDHVIDPTFLHGTQHARLNRPRKGMLASRADGPWTDGLPFRGRYWLRGLGAHPAVGMSTATLGVGPARDCHGDQRERSIELFQTPAQLIKMTSTAAPAHKQSLRHEFTPGSDGPHIQLDPGLSDVQLQQALASYGQVRLLRVALRTRRDCWAATSGGRRRRT